MTPLRFFTLQLLCVLGWFVTLGGVGFTITSGSHMMFVIQGWHGEPIEVAL